jgi:hypothetical protein
MLVIKVGTSLFGISNQILFALSVANDVYDKMGRDCVLTSGSERTRRGDGTPVHKRGSAHYAGNAVDIRTNNLVSGSESVVKDKLVEALGAEYDVILEGLGEPWEHIHIEYDPKE